MKLLLRRCLAFLVDVNLYLVAWDVVNNLVALPIPEGVLQLAKGAAFALYAALFAAVSPTLPTPGKLLLGLRVASLDGAAITRRRLAGKSLVLGLLLLTDWPEVLHTLGAMPLPAWLSAAAYGLPRGLVLACLALALVDRSGLTPLDRWAGIRVLRRLDVERRVAAPAPAAAPEPTSVAADSGSPSAATEAAPPASPPVGSAVVPAAWVPPARPPLPAAGRLLVAAGLAALTIGIAVQSEVLKRGGDASVLSGPDIARGDVGPQLEALVRQRVGVRCRITVSAHLRREGSEPPWREIKLDYWVPVTGFSDGTMERVLESTFEHLTVNEGAFDSLRVVFRTGEDWARLALEEALAIPGTVKPNASGEDTVCVGLTVPPNEFETVVGAPMREPLTMSHVEFTTNMSGRTVLRKDNLLGLPVPQPKVFCLRIKSQKPAPSALGPRLDRRPKGSPPARRA